MDAISPIPPIGSEEKSLSTYWIDRAIQKIEDGKDGHLQGGNATSLVLDGSHVVATSD